MDPTNTNIETAAEAVVSEAVASEAAASLNAIIEQERARRVELEQINRALVQEFTSCNDFDDIRKKFKDKLKDYAPHALTNIIRLATGAESESVQANLNKWILEWVMSDKLDSSESELQGLLKQLAKQPTSSSTST